MSDRPLSEDSQVETTGVSFVADLELLSWDLAIIGEALCLEREVRLLGHLRLVEHSQ